MEKNQRQRINSYTKATEIQGENALMPPFSSVALSALELVPSVFRFLLSSTYKDPSKDLIQASLIICLKVCFPAFYSFKISQQ